MEHNPICKGCKQEFVFKTARKDFFEAAKYFEMPLFCPKCFEAHLEKIWKYPGQQRAIICSSCGIESKLHFVPAKDQEVFCPKCYQLKKS